MINVQRSDRLIDQFDSFRLLYNDAEANRDRDVDLLEVLSLLARNPIGRNLF